MSKLVANNRGSSSERRYRRAVFLTEQCGQCYFCGDPLGEVFIEKHIQPLTRGGRGTRGNRRLVHERCAIQFDQTDAVGQRRTLLDAKNRRENVWPKLQRLAAYRRGMGEGS